VTGLDKKLLDQRDAIRAVLDKKWWQAALLTAGPPAYLLFRRRYGRPVRHSAAPGADGQPPTVGQGEKAS